jgi:hypothetical protein
MDLKELAVPFPPGDIEWRVSRSWLDKKGKVVAKVLAYVTARAIEKRLDDVCGPENWCNTPLHVVELRPGITAMQVGISIRIGDEWVTKYDVSDPTHFEPVKGGFSGAMKRAGAQWGIARYLYHLSETNAETAFEPAKGWEWAQVAKKREGDETTNYYWKPPLLPGWALPRDKDTDVAKLKSAWKAKFAPKEKDRQVLITAFEEFVFNIVGEFPIDDPDLWTEKIFIDVRKRIDNTTDPRGPSSDVPFE